jgi:hypothetical protein
VGSRRSARRERIRAAFDAFHAAVGATLGAAARIRDAAVADHARAMVEKWLRDEGLDAARADPGLARVFGNLQLAEAIAEAEHDRRTAFEEWMRSGPAALDAILDEAAPGSAGLPWERWLGTVGTADGIGGAPGLWRIGTARAGGGQAFGVGVPLLDESHLQVSSLPAGRSQAEAMIEWLVMRVLSYFRPGLVHVHVWDVAQFTGSMPGLYPLTRTGLLTVHDPALLPALLDELSDRIRRVHTRVLVDGSASLRDHAGDSRPRTEPWIVAVLLGNRQTLRDEEHRQLQRVARGGLACGVQLVLLDVPMTMNASVETIRVTAPDRATCSMTGPYAAVELDTPPERSAVLDACQRIVAGHQGWQARVGSFEDLLPPPGDWGGELSTSGLFAPIGFTEGLAVEIGLADTSPHALIGGPSGTGKTNLMLAAMSSLASRYSPDELEFYLLDFKEGVSFAQFAPGRRDTTWLPHAKLVGININTDREFGVALLQFLADEMRRRAEAAKAHEVTKLEELRDADPDGRWPRIVAVIDEFQYLFAERDTVTRTAIGLLEDVARRGRSQGIHLVLASQDVSGIEAFWGRRAIFEQFVLRIALPRSRQVLADRNDATLDLPRWHAVINAESGVRHANQVARIPNATVKDTVDRVQRVLHAAYVDGEWGVEFGQPRPCSPAGVRRPTLFDGSRAPLVVDLLAGVDTAGAVPRVLVGQCIDIDGSAATIAVSDVPGRNLAVLGPSAPDAVPVLSAAAVSLRRRFADGEIDVVLAALAPEAAGPAAAVAEELRAGGREPRTAGLRDVEQLVKELAAEVAERARITTDGRLDGDRRPLFAVLFAADAADPVLDRAGVDALRQVLRFGPENGVHVLGWWRSVARLRALLSLSASIDDVGALVALDVQGSELGALLPGMTVSWSPRPGRGLFFDRAQHSRPDVVIVPSLVLA